VDIPLESECTGRRVLGDGSLNLIQNIHSAYYSSFGKCCGFRDCFPVSLNLSIHRVGGGG